MSIAPLGLTSDDVIARRRIDGPNRLPSPPSASVWRLLAFEMVHFFALVLWGAGALAFVAGMPQLGVAIFAVVVVNGTFAFVQERRAENAAEHLRRLLPQKCVVIRDGTRSEVDAEELVVGDLVVLSEGDRVSADLRLLEVDALSLDVSSLTGESVPTHPEIDSSVFAGSFVVEGGGLALVLSTGSRTRLAQLSRLTTQGKGHRTPLRRELEHVSRLIAVMAVGIGASFFFVSVLLDSEPVDAFLFAVGVTVALVPEGLLPTVTLSLSMGAQRMASRRALVRHLEAAETLGSTTFICTDKTGTLTRNEMEVLEVWTPEGSARISPNGYEPETSMEFDDETVERLVAELSDWATQCGSGRIVQHDGVWTPHGDPMEAAIDALARRSGDVRNDDADHGGVVSRFPFDPRRRRMSVILDEVVVVKGAPDSIFDLCDESVAARDAHHRLANRGLRVLAVAARARRPDDGPGSTVQSVERDLHLLGLLGLEDPPRAGTTDSIRACRNAGVNVAMVTGDHPGTAAAIAGQIGLSLDSSPVISGSELPIDDDELGEVLDHDGIVIARVTPEDKLRITEALQRRGHVVAMTGDGVNDAPALRSSSIGIAMGRTGTDVARDAADLILLDDDFATIVVAIEQGRSTFANIRRFLTYYLAGNVAELAPFVVWALSGSRIPLAIGVLQIIALDIGTSVLPALALGAQPPSAHVLESGPRTRHLLTRSVLIRAFAVLGPAISIIELAAFFAVFLLAGWRTEEAFPGGTILLGASGAAFSAVVLGQVANAFACRSSVQPVWRVPIAANRLLVAAVLAEVLLGTLFLLPPIAGILGQQAPPFGGILVAACALPLVVVVDAVQKWNRRRRLFSDG